MLTKFLCSSRGTALPHLPNPRLWMDFGVVSAAARELLPVILALGRWGGHSISVPACPPCPALNCGSLTCSGQAYSGLEKEGVAPDHRGLGWALAGAGFVLLIQFLQGRFRPHFDQNILKENLRPPSLGQRGARPDFDSIRRASGPGCHTFIH